MKRIAVIGCALAPAGYAQFTRPNPVRLRINVSNADDISQKVRDATVELMDPVGASSEMDKKLTDQSGQVEFNTSTGQHRIRVTADGMYPYEGDFQISPVETFHTETIRLVRKEDAGTSATAASKETVPVIRLKIPEKARREFDKASRLMSEENWAESRKHLQSAIDIYPEYDLAYNGLGIVCLRMKDVQAAEKAFRKAIELNSKFAEAQRNLARISLGSHNYQEAASLLNQSLETDPINPWALTNAAYAELELRRFKEAAAHALQVHAFPHQGLANAHVIAAYALDALGRKQESMEQWQLYLKEDPKGPNANRARDELARLGKDRQ
jgi:Flp pilus assembly protein TadD